jgi:hypothetical protein
MRVGTGRPSERYTGAQQRAPTNSQVGSLPSVQFAPNSARATGRSPLQAPNCFLFFEITLTPRVDSGMKKCFAKLALLESRLCLVCS